jgi:hypothetical protein
LEQGVCIFYDSNSRSTASDRAERELLAKKKALTVDAKP